MLDYSVIRELSFSYTSYVVINGKIIFTDDL
jgi:hypothetical protein